MVFAAAAVVGTARGNGGLQFGRRPFGPPLSPTETSFNGSNIVTALATVLCVVLNAVGVSMLVNSLTDTRAVLVNDYDEYVVSWEEAARGYFEGLVMNVTARLTNGRNLSQTMETKSSAVEFRDAEKGQGLLPFHPLEYVASFEFDPYYPGKDTLDGISESDWQLLSPRDEANHVIFEFGGISVNGSKSNFTTKAFPLAWDETVHVRNPAPNDRCRREKHGTWRNKECHIVKKLNHVCLQVSVDSDGVWRPHDKGDTSGPLITEVNDTEGRYGCDPANDWNPAVYSTDKCWGHPLRRCTEAHPEVHRVVVTLRSSLDPYIRAEELTDSTMDFGLAPATQRANGIALLAIGLCICLVPCAKVCQFLQSRKKKHSEEQRALRYQQDSPRGLPGGVCPPGVYGNTTS